MVLVAIRIHLQHLLIATKPHNIWNHLTIQFYLMPLSSSPTAILDESFFFFLIEKFFSHLRHLHVLYSLPGDIFGLLLLSRCLLSFMSQFMPLPQRGFLCLLMSTFLLFCFSVSFFLAYASHSSKHYYCLSSPIAYKLYEERGYSTIFSPITNPELTTISLGQYNLSH